MDTTSEAWAQIDWWIKGHYSTMLSYKRIRSIPNDVTLTTRMQGLSGTCHLAKSYLTLGNWAWGSFLAPSSAFPEKPQCAHLLTYSVSSHTMVISTLHTMYRWPVRYDVFPVVAAEGIQNKYLRPFVPVFSTAIAALLRIALPTDRVIP
jgi:hypothetical protein